MSEVEQSRVKQIAEIVNKASELIRDIQEAGQRKAFDEVQLKLEELADLRRTAANISSGSSDQRLLFLSELHQKYGDLPEDELISKYIQERCLVADELRKCLAGGS